MTNGELYLQVERQRAYVGQKVRNVAVCFARGASKAVHGSTCRHLVVWNHSRDDAGWR